MTNLNPIPLDKNWRIFPPKDFDPTYGGSQLDIDSWDALDSLTDWTGDLLSRADKLHLRRTFDLEPITDICIRYMLHIEAAPQQTAVFINGWHVGTVGSGKALTADVTDYVTLEGNILLLTIGEKGSLRGVWLQPVPCET